MRITGVVKGTEQDAIVAANKHGLQIKVLHVLADSVTVEFTDPNDNNEIAAWFCESPLLAPFPIGTLLLYSHHGDGPLPSEQAHNLSKDIGDDLVTYLEMALWAMYMWPAKLPGELDLSDDEISRLETKLRQLMSKN